ncbi:hypothetical protein [Nocardioides sp.]|uniref:hypothetical protein n=1 Tax=Nocardioides sp. TaxID=35761 RepID=UPI00378432C8
MQRLTRRRGRALASLITVAGLGIGAAAAVAGPAQSADPAGDCAVAYPEADLTAGQDVTGLTVTHGTTPEGFTGEVLGVLDDGIAPDVDMIMVRLTSPEIDRVGIWQGMSGSPVYAGDGRLIGAVSYGLAMGGSPVAGVTPYESMDDYLADAAGKVAVDRAAARQIARHSDVSVAQAREGFEQLPMPLGVAGVGARALAKAEQHASGHRWLPRSTYAVGRASAAAAGADDIVAGGNLAASMTWGDVTMAGIGTATSVCGDRVVGFGHPMNWTGDTTLGLHPADAIYIQEDLIAGFKVANLGDPVGTITDDRMSGIAGTLGPLPDTADLTVGLTHGDRSRTGVTHIADRTPDTMAWSTFYGIIADHQALVDGPVQGSEDLTWTITGTDADGASFSLSSGDLYASESDLTYRLGFAIGDVVYALAKIPGVTIDTITTDSDLVDTVSTLKISKIEVKQGGEWVTLKRRSGLVARGGQVLHARVTLTGDGAPTQVVPASLQVPASFSGRMVALQVVSGAQSGSERMPRDIDEIQAWLEDQVRNDEMVVALSRGPRVHHGSEGSAHGRFRGGDDNPRTVQTVLGPFGSVVRGRFFSIGEAR